MERTIVDAINKLIDEIISNHFEEISTSLLAGTYEGMPKDKVFSIMIRNCLSESVKLSSQVILGLLQSEGLIQIDERETAKQLLKQLSTDLKD